MPHAHSQYPLTRPRRVRQAPWVRDLVQETRLTVKDLIWPMFVIDGTNTREPIASLPGVDRLTVDLAVQAAQQAFDLGIPLIAVFPKTDPQLKTPDGAEAFNPNNLVCRAVRAIKQAVPGLGIMCDVALDPYTSHGHDGLLVNGEIVNDATIQALIKQSLNQVAAGCDVLGPSDMMDGRVGAIRHALEQAGHHNTLIMAYSAKYASAFYGPFREAVGSLGVLKGDKKTYQQDPANSQEALREVALDLQEGADMVMVKPGLPYLDILQRVKATFGVPTTVYHVSGEYAMLKAAALNGWLDYDKALLETLLAFKRAGADGILTYAACDAARLLRA